MTSPVWFFNVWICLHEPISPLACPTPFPGCALSASIETSLFTPTGLYFIHPKIMSLKESCNTRNHYDTRSLGYWWSRNWATISWVGQQFVSFFKKLQKFQPFFQSLGNWPLVDEEISKNTSFLIFKKAIVCPLIKKSTLDKNILENYRPVSNLSCISKITEIVASRFKKHLLKNSLHEPKQSAYRSHHSTETALISVTKYIMCAVDQKKAVVLVLLDLSAAFDTIDHSILLNRLQKRCGITGTALSWFETYLTDRCQVIQLNGESFDKMQLQFGVPQGSVLGPLLFTSYTAPLGEIARRHSVELHLYADDTQVYMSFSPLSDESTTRTFQRIEACIAEIRTWLKDNKLMLNDDKTDVGPLVISSVSMRSKLQVPHLKMRSSLVTPSHVVCIWTVSWTWSNRSRRFANHVIFTSFQSTKFVTF